MREIDDDEGRRLVRIVRRGTGSVVTWRRARMVLLSTQGMDVPAVAKVAFTSEDRIRDVIRNSSADGFGSLYPKYRGGRPPKFTLPQRREARKIAKSRPAGHDLPFSAQSLPELAEFLVAEGVVDDISHEGLRTLLREEGVSLRCQLTADKDLAPRRTRTTRRRRPGSSTCTRSPTARWPQKPANRRSSSAWTSSGRSTCSPGPAGSGPRPAGRTPSLAEPRGRGCARPTPAPPGCGICPPPMNWARTSSAGISSRARPAPGSWSSAATCARPARQTSASRSPVTTSTPT